MPDRDLHIETAAPALTIEERVLEVLDVEEGTEVHMIMSATRRQASGALQRLQRKGLATPEQCPDGAWVWFRTDPENDNRAARESGRP